MTTTTEVRNWCNELVSMPTASLKDAEKMAEHHVRRTQSAAKLRGIVEAALYTDDLDACRRFCTGVL
ncbi:MAG: hypothetical protein AAFX81_06245 [Pseudomonadota bacterium]